MIRVDYDFDRYIRLVESFRNVRESVLEGEKIEQQIRNSHKEDQRHELDRKKKFINDFIDIGKFFLKLCATGLIAATALSSAGITKGLLTYVSLGGVIFGTIIVFVGINYRSKVEEDYIRKLKTLTKTLDESLAPLAAHSAAILQETEILNEMVKLEQKSIAEAHPELRDMIYQERRK